MSNTSAKGALIAARVRGKVYKVSGCLDLSLYTGMKFTECSITDEDGAPVRDFGESFAGMPYDEEDVASSISEAFLNGNEDVSFLHVCPELRALQNALNEEYSIKVGGETIRRVYIGGDGALTLMLVDADGSRYYENGESFKILRPDGSIATDMEVFYSNALVDSLERGDYRYKAKEVCYE